MRPLSIREPPRQGDAGGSSSGSARNRLMLQKLSGVAALQCLPLKAQRAAVADV